MRKSCQRALEHAEFGTAVARGAPMLVAQSDNVGHVGVSRQEFTFCTINDFFEGVRRTINGPDDRDRIARTHAAVGSVVSHKCPCFVRRDWINRTYGTADCIIELHRADMEVMGVDMVPRSDSHGCKPYDLPIATHWVTNSDCFDGDFVTRTDELIQCDAPSRCIYGSVGMEWDHGNDDVVGRVQVDGCSLL